MSRCSSSSRGALDLAFQWGQRSNQKHQKQNVLGITHAINALTGSQDSQQQQQQLTWLPQHTASAQLVQSLQDAAQRVWKGITAAGSEATSISVKVDGSHAVPSSGSQPAWLAPATFSSGRSAASIAAPLPARWTQRCSSLLQTSVTQHPSWARAAHTAADSFDDSSSRQLSPEGSRRHVGRAHRPLFSNPDSHTSSYCGSKPEGHVGNSGTHISAGRARTVAAAAVVLEDEGTETDDGDDGQQLIDEDEPLLPTDLRDPHLWYPAARSMAPRSWLAHLGPTNSGKTHTALEALAAAPSGVYCGPLRLLACEVADRLNARGVPCNLITGQEVRYVKGAQHTACTVEMADLASTVDVAVLDEIQMLGDRCRGWSWTRVLLGLPAAELHLCGDPAAGGLLQKLAAECGDTLAVNHYRRLAPLVVQPQPLQGLYEVQEGDCVVAFGRKTLHRLRAQIVKHMSDTTGTDTDSNGSNTEYNVAEQCSTTWHTHSSSSSEDECSTKVRTAQGAAAAGAAAAAAAGVGMVYGALPPESRRTQAALFNARRDACLRTSVLVASDAVGMGLNLNIRRIVFTTLHKYDGVETRPLSTSEIKQIAGRAGRYASGHAEGYVSVLNPDDLPLLRQALATATPDITHACLLPRFEQLEQFVMDHYADVASRHNSRPGRRRRRHLSFHKLLNAFASCSQLSDAYLLADTKNMLLLAKRLKHLEPHLDLQDMYTCCISPASIDDAPVVQALMHIAASYAFERHVTPECLTLPCPQHPPRSHTEMKEAEEVFRVYDLYLWLYDRLGAPGVFRGRRQVLRQRQQVAELIDVALQRMGGVGAGS